MPANRFALAYSALEWADAEVERDTDGTDVSVTIGAGFHMNSKEFRAHLVDLEGSLHVRFLDRWAELGPVLSGLTRLHLDLRGAKVNDLTPLAGLSGLRSLYLDSCEQVSILTPLAGLSGLESIYLTKTRVSDLTPLAGLSGLRSLNLVSTQVSDLKPLAGLSGVNAIPS